MTKINKKIVEKGKRNKRELSYEMKKKIIKTWKEKQKQNVKYTRIMLSNFLEAELGYKVPPTTLGEIINK